MCDWAWAWLLRHTIALGRLVVYTITLNHLNACGWAYVGMWYKEDSEEMK